MELDLLAFGAHPDDIEFSCSGTISKMTRLGYKVGIVDLTRGEMGTRGTPQIRERETKAANKIMGISVRHNLGLPDANVPTGSNLEIIEIIRSYRPGLLLLPYIEERHPDHAHACHLVMESSFKAGLEKIKTASAPFRPPWTIHYMQHYEFQPAFVVDISEDFETKMRAARAYRSQLYNPAYQKKRKERQTLLSTPHFLTLLETRSRYFGSLIGVSFGEPFWMRTMIGIKNPVDFFKSHLNFRKL